MSEKPSIIMSNADSDKIEIRITAIGITSKEFGRVYDLYVKKIYRFAYLKVGSREEAEDLTSETFLKAWDYFSRTQNRKISNIKAFLYQVANNLIADFYRKRKLVSFSLNQFENADKLVDARADAFEKIEKNEEVQELMSAIKNIPENYANIIIWYHLEGLKISEIAEILKKSEGTVRVTIHRALKALKNKLESASLIRNSFSKESRPAKTKKEQQEQKPIIADFGSNIETNFKKEIEVSN